MTLYLLDWDSTSRSTRVDVLDAATQQVLSTQAVSSYNPGKHLTWNVQGHVGFRLTNQNGANAVLTGLFFDAVRWHAPIRGRSASAPHPST